MRDGAIVIMAFGLIIAYFLLRFFINKQRSPFELYSNVLTDNKYKVKSQWDK